MTAYVTLLRVFAITAVLAASIAVIGADHGKAEGWEFVPVEVQR